MVCSAASRKELMHLVLVVIALLAIVNALAYVFFEFETPVEDARIQDVLNQIDSKYRLLCMLSGPLRFYAYCEKHFSQQDYFECCRENLPSAQDIETCRNGTFGYEHHFDQKCLPRVAAGYIPNMFFVDTDGKRRRYSVAGAFLPLLTEIDALEGQIEHQWRYRNCVFCAAQVVSTIGYGSTSPKATQSKIAIILGTVPAIAIFGALAASFAMSGERLAEKLYNPHWWCTRLTQGRPERANILFSCVCVLVLTFSGAWIFCGTEGWTYLDSLYFCIVTISTVGLGDFIPTSGAGQLFWYFFMFISLGVVANLINAIAGLWDVAIVKLDRISTFWAKEGAIEDNQTNNTCANDSDAREEAACYGSPEQHVGERIEQAF